MAIIEAKGALLMPPAQSPFTAKRIAIKFEPPTLLLELCHKSSRRHFNHKVLFRNLTAGMSSSIVCRQIIDANVAAFASIPEKQLLRLIDVLIAQSRKQVGEPSKIDKEALTRESPVPSRPTGEGQRTAGFDGEDKSECVTTLVSAQELHSDTMEHRGGVSSQDTPGDFPTLERPVPLSQATMQSSEIENLLNDIASPSSPRVPIYPPPPETLIGALSASGAAMPGDGSEPGAGSDIIDLGAIDDLQRVNEEYLRTVKGKMGEEFSRRMINKEHPDYVYDKQVEFGSPTESNDWDDE